MKKRESTYHLFGKIKYTLPEETSFNGNKFRRCLLDEFPIWKEATPEEAKAAKIAYEKWKVENKLPL